MPGLSTSNPSFPNPNAGGTAHQQMRRTSPFDPFSQAAVKQSGYGYSGLNAGRGQQYGFSRFAPGQGGQPQFGGGQQRGFGGMGGSGFGGFGGLGQGGPFSQFLNVQGAYGNSPQPYLPFPDETLNTAMDNQFSSGIQGAASPQYLLKGMLNANAGTSTDVNSPGNFQMVAPHLARAGSEVRNYQANAPYQRNLANYDATFDYQNAAANEGLDLAGLGNNLQDMNTDFSQSQLMQALQFLFSMLGGLG